MAAAAGGLAARPSPAAQGERSGGMVRLLEEPSGQVSGQAPDDVDAGELLEDVARCAAAAAVRTGRRELSGAMP